MRIPDVVARFDVPSPLRAWFIPFATTGWSLWFMFWWHALVAGRPGSFAQWSPFDGGLWLLLLVAALVWFTLASLGRVGAGSGAGLLLAILGLLSRARGTWSVLFLGAADMTNAPPGTGSVLTLASFHRNAGLVAFGLGLGLAAASSALDAVRRRTTPAWTRPEA